VGDDAARQPLWLGVTHSERGESLHSASNIVVKLAAFAADQTMSRAFGASARIERAIEIVRE
jgi:hypothetical protein